MLSRRQAERVEYLMMFWPNMRAWRVDCWEVAVSRTPLQDCGWSGLSTVWNSCRRVFLQGFLRRQPPCLVYRSHRPNDVKGVLLGSEHTSFGTWHSDITVYYIGIVLPNIAGGESTSWGRPEHLLRLLAAVLGQMR